MADDVKPDPGNSVPEDWTEDLTDTEIRDISRMLAEEFGGEA